MASQSSTRGAFTPQRIIESALTIVARNGPTSLTVDALRAETGLSRGGLAHHFRSQTELLEATIRHSLDAYRGALEREVSGGGDSIAGYADVTLGTGMRYRLALMLGLAQDPGLLTEWAAFFRLQDANPGGSELVSTACLRRLAIDGLCWTKILNPHRFSAQRMERLATEVLTWSPEPIDVESLPTSPSRRHRGATKERILQAVRHVALKLGGSSVTMERVRNESGISKSGILYHFDSKGAMLQSFFDEIAAGSAEISQAGLGERGWDLRTLAYARANIAHSDATMTLLWILAISSAPHLSSELAKSSRIIDSAEDALPEPLWLDVQLRRLALDGLCWSDLIDPQRFSRLDRDGLLRRLVGRTQDELFPRLATTRSVRTQTGPQ
ncbi:MULTISPECIES: TetR family transcriptional regulator [unclassified Pseudofrankia]|uniref:TetR family transcriptional regulator n=1 Tax=unclassified Pseudofrankia TaxID=2994372 RepID=UPI0008DA9461|nr:MULTISPECIES: TetR family transcriptional regulator [unclassified Pseudofrankia]MDT3439293.1 TetR family transcriptional regulator [Pseudofrankia sp. BMG5.37]OHV73974.1 hypothetical protein BCD48_32760 [Pseudofrankia sp. BMG5.36]